jgi:lactoylglutathione lyase
MTSVESLIAIAEAENGFLKKWQSLCRLSKPGRAHGSKREAASPVTEKERSEEKVSQLSSWLRRFRAPILIPMVTKFLHTRYRVTDLEKTLHFYREVLGLEEVSRKKSDRGSELVFLKAPGSEALIEICKYDGSGPVVVGPDLTHLAFGVEDMEAFAKHAAALGYPLSDGPHKTSSGSVLAFVDAPDGYEVELIQPAP